MNAPLTFQPWSSSDISSALPTKKSGSSMRCPYSAGIVLPDAFQAAMSSRNAPGRTTSPYESGVFVNVDG